MNHTRSRRPRPSRVLAVTAAAALASTVLPLAAGFASAKADDTAGSDRIGTNTIVFQSLRDGNDDLYSVNPDGTGLRGSPTTRLWMPPRTSTRTGPPSPSRASATATARSTGWTSRLAPSPVSPSMTGSTSARTTPTTGRRSSSSGIPTVGPTSGQ